MNLNEIKFLSEVSYETGISVRQLTRRIDKLIKEGVLIKYKDYKKCEGRTGTYILSQTGIKKIIKG